MNAERDPLAVSQWLLTTADAAWSYRVIGPVSISGDDRPVFTAHRSTTQDHANKGAS